MNILLKILFIIILIILERFNTKYMKKRMSSGDIYDFGIFYLMRLSKEKSDKIYKFNIFIGQTVIWIAIIIIIVDMLI